MKASDVKLKRINERLMSFYHRNSDDKKYFSGIISSSANTPNKGDHSANLSKLAYFSHKRDKRLSKSRHSFTRSLHKGAKEFVKMKRQRRVRQTEFNGSKKFTIRDPKFHEESLKLRLSSPRKAASNYCTAHIHPTCTCANCKKLKDLSDLLTQYKKNYGMACEKVVSLEKANSNLTEDLTTAQTSHEESIFQLQASLNEAETSLNAKTTKLEQVLQEAEELKQEIMRKEEETKVKLENEIQRITERHEQQVQGLKRKLKKSMDKCNGMEKKFQKYKRLAKQKINHKGMLTPSNVFTHDQDTLVETSNLLVSVKDSDFNLQENNCESFKLEMIRYKNKCRELKNILFSYENREKGGQRDISKVWDKVCQVKKTTDQLVASSEKVLPLNKADSIKDFLDFSDSSHWRISDFEDELEDFLSETDDNVQLRTILQSLGEINAKLNELFQKSTDAFADQVSNECRIQ
ncbi:unnamed protein product [Moneuplotes crassus]|uniref:Uncharacterized protein n=1 Tax=Euplotes crassus TaxID=5936 RepID=A0AAD1U5Q6_EUPCR|nr:unnamed protein product [Moneuplotes crassus]